MESPRKKPVIQPPQRPLLIKHSKSTMTELTKGKGQAPWRAEIGSSLWKFGSSLAEAFVGKPLRFIARVLPYIGYISVIYLFLITLCYNEILDPCVLKYPYARYCQKVVFLSENFFSYTEYKENYVCFMPGVFYQSESKGWYSDTEQC